MTLQDKIYGEFNIEELVLAELLHSSPIIRLNNISQYGVPDKYYHRKNYSRYEHSVGVMLLLRKLGTSLEEQIAGLLHDISVLAFSHIADWVFAKGNLGEEDYHNQIHKKFVKETEIPNILEKYGFSAKRLLDENNFPFLEQPIPSLCADRVDYALREFDQWLNPEIINPCMGSLTTQEREIIFSDSDAALAFATNFLELQTQHWGSHEAVLRYHLFSKALKLALEIGIIDRNDFYQDEPCILAKLQHNQHEEMASILNSLERKDLDYTSNNDGKDKVYKKFRFVDPKVISATGLERLSELVPEFQQLIDRHREINQRGLLI